MLNSLTSLRQEGYRFDATSSPGNIIPPQLPEAWSPPPPPPPATTTSSILRVIPPTARTQGSRRATAVFIPLHEWEGAVTRVLDDAFTASLVDLSERQKGIQLEAEFPRSDLLYDTQELLKEGAIFRWMIGYALVEGTLFRGSRIVFRRLPAWTKRDFEKASRRAKEISSSVTYE